MSLSHTRSRGMLIQKYEAAQDIGDKLRALEEYMKYHAHDVQDYLHHTTQGSVYCGKASERTAAS